MAKYIVIIEEVIRITKEVVLEGESIMEVFDSANDNIQSTSKKNSLVKRHIKSINNKE